MGLKAEEAYGANSTEIKKVATGFDHATQTSDTSYSVYFIDGSRIDLNIPVPEDGVSVVGFVSVDDTHFKWKYSDGTFSADIEYPTQIVKVSIKAGNALQNITTPGEEGIYVSATGVQVSSKTDNLLETIDTLGEEGLYVGHDDEKLDIQQDVSDAGKALVVGVDGKVTTGDAGVKVSSKANNAIEEITDAGEEGIYVDNSTLHEHVAYTDDEIEAIFKGTPERIEQLSNIMRDDIVSDKTLWSSKQINDELTQLSDDLNDKTLVVKEVTKEYYDALPNDETGKLNPSIIWRITDAGTDAVVIKDTEISKTSTWSSYQINENLDSKVDKNNVLSLSRKPVATTADDLEDGFVIAKALTNAPINTTNTVSYKTITYGDNTDYRVQEATINSTSRKFIRHKAEGNWYDWQELVTTEYVNANCLTKSGYTTIASNASKTFTFTNGSSCELHCTGGQAQLLSDIITVYCTSSGAINYVSFRGATDIEITTSGNKLTLKNKNTGNSLVVTPIKLLNGLPTVS